MAKLAAVPKREGVPVEPPLPTTAVTMRAPCYQCGELDGLVTRQATQVVVRCAHCQRYQYNAPKREQIKWWGQTK